MDHKYYNKKCIVGYISKQDFVEIKKKCKNKKYKKHYAVLGDTFLFSFNDSLPIESLKFRQDTRIRKVDEKDTKIILTSFENKKNILHDCVKEIKRIDKNNITCKRNSKDFECNLQNRCLRWKL